MKITKENAERVGEIVNEMGELLYFAEAGHNEIGGNASLDRIDSTKGYTPENIHWVHKYINVMKMDLPLNTFLTMCKKVVDKHPEIL